MQEAVERRVNSTLPPLTWGKIRTQIWGTKSDFNYTNSEPGRVVINALRRTGKRIYAFKKGLLFGSEKITQGCYGGSDNSWYVQSPPSQRVNILLLSFWRDRRGREFPGVAQSQKVHKTAYVSSGNGLA